MAKGAAAAGAKTEDTTAEKPAAKAVEKPEEKPDASIDTKADEKPAKTEKTFTKAELEAATAKAAADALKKAEAEKDLSELEKANNRIKELEAGQRLRDAKESVVEALTKAGARSPELLWKTLQSDLEFDDKGGIKNLDVLVTGLKTDYADQFGEAKPGETIDGGAGTGGGGTTLTKEKLEKMTQAEIKALPWDEVKKVLAAG